MGKKVIPDNNVKYIESLDINALQVRIKPKPIRLKSHEEVYNYLKTQDLSLFLGVDTNPFRCVLPNHDDKNPSASIVLNKENGHYIYNCLSSNCSYKGSIIQLTMELTKHHKLNIAEVLRFLRKVYKIVYVENEWQILKKETLIKNKILINSDELKVLYPVLYRRIKNYLPVLNYIINNSKDHLYTEYFSDSRGNPLFFISNRYLAEKCRKDKKDINNIVALFTYLELVNKLSINEIPSFLLEKSKKLTSGKVITYLSIPTYNHEILSFSESKAIEFKKYNLTMKGLSREMLLRTFGEKEANRVYPQMTGVKIPELNEEISMQMKKVALNLIYKKGYTTEAEILDHTRLYFRGQKLFKEHQLKRIIGEFILEYDLFRIRLNKRLKAEYGITVNGYPFIIIPKRKIDYKTREDE